MIFTVQSIIFLLRNSLLEFASKTKKLGTTFVALQG